MPLLDFGGEMKLAALGVLVLLACLLPGISPPPAAAEGPAGVHELRIGLLDHDTDGLWSRSKREGGNDINAEVIFAPSRQVLGGTLRPNLGFSVNDRGLTGKVYAGALWRHPWRNRLFFELGLGLAAHNGITEDAAEPHRKQLGSRVLFRVAVEAGMTFKEHHSLSLMFDHVSNAYLADPNEGMDTVGLRYGYRF